MRQLEQHEISDIREKHLRILRAIDDKTEEKKELNKRL